LQRAWLASCPTFSLQMSETSHQMKMRHKRELQELSKRPLGKGKGAKQDRRKEEDEMKARHEAELKLLTMKVTESKEEETPAEAAKPDGPSRAQKRKAKKEAAEAERRARWLEESKNAPNPRQQELAAIQAALSNKSLQVKEILSDGHCLYRAIADQLALQNDKSPSYLELRQRAAAYLRDHPDDFLAFITDDEGNPLPAESFSAYCDSVAREEPAVWGGHAEIVALSKALDRCIAVYSAGAEPIVTGDSNSDKPINISFHRHYFGLGEHYNSIVPVLEEEEEEEEEEEKEVQ